MLTEIWIFAKIENSSKMFLFVPNVDIITDTNTKVFIKASFVKIHHISSYSYENTFLKNLWAEILQFNSSIIQVEFI